MRKLCPICNTEPSSSFQIDFAVPSGWTLPNTSYVKLCPACGFIWHDNDSTQADYDTFYKERYGYGADTVYDKQRMMELSASISANYSRDIKILDIGGGVGYLETCLRELGFDNVRTLGVGEEYDNGYDLVIFTHVLEHIYDLDVFMDHVMGCLNDGGHVLVEVPASYLFAEQDWPHILDYHQKHVNHFSRYSLDHLFTKYGFTNLIKTIYVFKLTNAACIRAIYLKGGIESTFDKIKMHVINHLDEIGRKISQNIKEPVIIYGVGDLAWALINYVQNPPIQIAGLVDNDPAYVGCTINGIPVTDKVEGDEPLLVMASGQKQNILKRIKELGLKNKVIDIDELEFTN